MPVAAGAVAASASYGDMRVAVANSADAVDWDRFVTRHPAATGYHAWAWREVFSRAFGHESI